MASQSSTPTTISPAETNHPTPSPPLHNLDRQPNYNTTRRPLHNNNTSLVRTHNNHFQFDQRYRHDITQQP